MSREARFFVAGPPQNDMRVEGEGRFANRPKRERWGGSEREGRRWAL